MEYPVQGKSSVSRVVVEVEVEATVQLEIVGLQIEILNTIRLHEVGKTLHALTPTSLDVLSPPGTTQNMIGEIATGRTIKDTHDMVEGIVDTQKAIAVQLTKINRNVNTSSNTM